LGGARIAGCGSFGASGADAELRARITEFYRLHVNGEYLKAEPRWVFAISAACSVWSGARSLTVAALTGAACVREGTWGANDRGAETGAQDESCPTLRALI